jgi:hypothetical protein
MTDDSRPPADIDNRVYSTLDISFDKSFWSRGNFPTYFVNGTDTVKLANPWVQSASNAAPFDERELNGPLEGQESAEIAEMSSPPQHSTSFSTWPSAGPTGSSRTTWGASPGPTRR